MAYVPVPDAWIQAGLPTKEEIFEYLKANQESFNTDIENLKQTSQIQIFNFTISGSVNEYTSTEITSRMPEFRAPVAGSITDIRMALLTASTSGVLQLEIDKSTDDGANWSPILTAPVDLSGTTPGSVSGSVNFVPSTNNFNQNDMFRVRLTGLQVNQGEFHISVYGEVA